MSNPNRAKQQFFFKLIILLLIAAVVAYSQYNNQLPSPLANYGWNAVWMFPALVFLFGRFLSRLGMVITKLIMKAKN